MIGYSFPLGVQCVISLSDSLKGREAVDLVGIFQIIKYQALPVVQARKCYAAKEDEYVVARISMCSSKEGNSAFDHDTVLLNG
jgi:hypothetical protein